MPRKQRIGMGLLGGNPTRCVRSGRPSVAGSGRAVFMAKLAARVPRPRTNLTGPHSAQFANAQAGFLISKRGATLGHNQDLDTLMKLYYLLQ